MVWCGDGFRRFCCRCRCVKGKFVAGVGIVLGIFWRCWCDWLSFTDGVGVIEGYFVTGVVVVGWIYVAGVGVIGGHFVWGVIILDWDFVDSVGVNEDFLSMV